MAGPGRAGCGWRTGEKTVRVRVRAWEEKLMVSPALGPAPLQSECAWLTDSGRHNQNFSGDLSREIQGPEGHGSSRGCFQ